MTDAKPCPVPHRDFRAKPMTPAEVRKVDRWYSAEVMRRAAAAVITTDCEKCGQPGRPYAIGHRCDEHRP